MLRLILTWAVILGTVSVVTQTRIVLNDNAFVTLNGSVSLVVENGSDNAISTAGTGGNIVSESENACIDWHVGTNTGTYTIPLTTTPVAQGGTGAKIPAEVTITGAGTGSGLMRVASYETADDNTPLAGAVTHVSNASGDQSRKMVDRFWIVNMSGYTVKPTATLAFTYDDSPGELGGTNTLNEASLQAQRWNSTANDWEGALFGSVNTTNNKVSGIPVAGEGFHSVWALVDNGFALPVELVSFDAECQDEALRFSWATASETNNDRFVIEQSTNGLDFLPVAEVAGQGTTSQTTHYEYRQEQTGTTDGYYRLRQIDFDGTTTVSNLLQLRGCHTGKAAVRLYPNPAREFVLIDRGYSRQEDAAVTVLNSLGAVVYTQTTAGTHVRIPVDQLANGNYFVRVTTNTETIVEPLIVSH